MTPNPLRPHIIITVECSECFADLEWDDGYQCPECRAQWSPSADDGTPADYWIDQGGEEQEWSDQ